MSTTIVVTRLNMSTEYDFSDVTDAMLRSMLSNLGSYSSPLQQAIVIELKVRAEAEWRNRRFKDMLESWLLGRTVEQHGEPHDRQGNP